LREQKFVAVHVAARMLGCSRDTIYRYIREGWLPARQFRKGTSYRIPLDAIEAMIERDAAENL